MKLLILAAALAATGCASLSPDGGSADVQALAGGNPLTGGAAPHRAPDAQSTRAVDELLTRPLDAEAAVRIALLNGPRMQTKGAELRELMDGSIEEGLRILRPFRPVE